LYGEGSDRRGVADDLFDLTDSAVVLTGASSGLGAHFADVLARAGARLLLVARREDRLRELASRLGSAEVLGVDLGDPDNAPRVITEAVSRLGGVDVLINNAGSNDHVPAIDEQTSEFERVLALNLTTPFVLCREAARVMMESGRGGTIVNIASVLGLVGLGQIPQAGYHASKGGLINLTRELAAQWARSGVRVNALAPGWFPSELTDELFTTDRGKEWLRRNTPMGRGGRVEELDGALLLLASGASSFMTGQVLVVDGGWIAV